MATRTTTAFRLPDDLYQRLNEAAQGYGLPMNFLVIKAIEDFLEHMIPPEEFRLTRRSKPTAQGVRAPGGGEALPIQGQSEGTP